MTHSGSYKIHSLIIKNFRQYHDVDIIFGRDPQKIFTILRGANGAGKTNIMNAITWCLYGTEKHINDDEKDFPIINTNAILKKPDGIIDMSVEIILADNDGEKIRIGRELTLLNNGATGVVNDKILNIPIPKKSVPSIKKSFQWHDATTGGWKSTEYFDKSVKDLLPEDLVMYFLFDGEKLEDFFEQIDDTKKGIEDVSQIKVTEKALDSLEDLITKIHRAAKNLDPQALAYKQQLQSKKSESKELKKKIKDIANEIKSTEIRIARNEKLLQKSGGDVSEYQQKAKKVRREIDYIQEQYQDKESERRDYILEHMFSISMLDFMDNTLQYITQKGDEGILPPKIKDTFLKELLDAGTCICGNDISAGHTSRARVNDLLTKAQYSEISEVCTDLKYELKAISNTDGMKSKLLNIEKIMIEYKDSRKEKQDELSELETKIGDVADESIKGIQKEKLELKKTSDRLNQELGGYRRDENILKKEIETYTTKYEQELEKDSKYKYLTDQLSFCKHASSSLKKIKNELLNDVRIKVQNYTKDYFLKFLWKRNTYDDVTIDEDYKITVHHVHGYNVRGDLSKGEKLVLALSFMAALRKITGFGFPLIIDTPFGRVSGEPRHNIADSLPEFLKNNQVILLVTDSEYQSKIMDDKNKQTFPAIRETIQKYVKADYDIFFDDNESKVVKHG